jgi:hypothetical protein
MEEEANNSSKKRKIFLIVGIILALLLIAGAYFFIARSEKTPVYVTFYSHNEEGDYWETLVNDSVAYLEYRNNLIEKVKLLNQYNVKWNWESDHSTLRAMIKHENSSLFSNTKGKNILRWMKEDMNVKIDPHGHLTEYNYADLAYLITQLGVEPSKVIGGGAVYECKFDENENIVQMNWRKSLDINTEGKIKGRKFPSYSWDPRIFSQPAMIGHSFDEFSSGIWKPSKTDVLIHDKNEDIILVGQGYPHYVANMGILNSGGARIAYSAGDYIKELVSKIDSGELKKGKIYTASISIRDNIEIYSGIPGPNALMNVFKGLNETLEALKQLQEQGKIIYLDYESVADIWENEYNSKANRVGIEIFSKYNEIWAETKRLCSSEQEIQTELCGDNVCDDIERENGLCSIDCG